MHPFTPYHKAVLSSVVHWFPAPCPFSSLLLQQQHGLQVTALIDPHHPGPNLPPHTDPVLGWHGNPWAERIKRLIIKPQNLLTQCKLGTWKNKPLHAIPNEILPISIFLLFSRQWPISKKTLRFILEGWQVSSRAGCQVSPPGGSAWAGDYVVRLWRILLTAQIERQN